MESTIINRTPEENALRREYFKAQSQNAPREHLDRIAPQDLLPHKTVWHLTTRCRSTSDKKGNQLAGRVIDGCTSTSVEALDWADANFLQLQETGVFPTEGAAHPQVREKDFRVPVSHEPCDSMNHIHTTFQLNENNPYRDRWPRVSIMTLGGGNGRV